MSPRIPMKWLLILGVLLGACVASAPAVRVDGDALDAMSSWEEARADPSCVVPLCEGERCAIWRCQHVVEVDPHPVVLAKGTLTLRPPGNPTRWWGRPLAAPVGTEPVFEIPWHNWNIRGQYAPRALRPPCIPSREPLEKHHIFPQEPFLANWFEDNGINIHSFTIRLPKSFHAWLHSGGSKGGQWNEAWRQFVIQNNTTATQEDIWRFAFELMNRFYINGSLVPYHCD
ncbi:TIGR02269 family lipoprotein [Archangium minus]|uniref:SitA6 family polymorphic toxin lipoprotein n=1 Tax=Archangium minus TaxID=83450 RepID=UPI0037C15039